MIPLSELLAEMEAGLDGTTAGPWAIDRYGAGQRVCAPSRKGFNGKPFRVADAHFSEGLADTARMPEAADNAAHIARCSPDNIARIIAGYREMEVLLREASAALDEGYWSASVYHCPPKGRKPATVMNAASISIRGKFTSEAEALAVAEAAIAQGRPDIGTFIHQPSAKPCAYFHVPSMAVLGQLRDRIKKELSDGE